MTHAERLERETEQTRNRISNILDELRAGISPGQVMDQIAGRFGGAGGAAFVSNLKRQTIDNPVPVALIGAGLAWLMFGGGTSRRTRDDFADALRGGAEWTEVAGDNVARARDAATEQAARLGEAASGSLDDARRWMGESADRVRETAAGAGESLRDAAGAAMDSLGAGVEGVRSAAGNLAGSANAARVGARRASQSMVDFCRDQPLVVAGLGLAIGAAVGALTPQGETEERLMAEAGARIGENAGAPLKAAKDAARRVAETAINAGTEAAKSEAQPGGGGKAEQSTAADLDALSSRPSQTTAQGG